MDSKFSNSRTENRTRVFKNPILEFLTMTHIAFPLTIFPMLSAGTIYLAHSTFEIGINSITIWVLSSFFLFTLFEYIIHRKVFHWEPNTPFKKFIQYHFHGLHHAEPKDKKRLAMPIVVSFSLYFVLLALAFLIIGKYSFVFAPGFALGYTAYLGVHFMVHAYAPPKSGPFKILWINHSIHHYKDDTVAFGVSSPLWDIVFGTLPKRKSA